MPTILIAEDYDDNRELLRIVLNTAGYEVHEARNGNECVNNRPTASAGSRYG